MGLVPPQQPVSHEQICLLQRACCGHVGGGVPFYIGGRHCAEKGLFVCHRMHGMSIKVEKPQKKMSIKHGGYSGVLEQTESSANRTKGAKDAAVLLSLLLHPSLSLFFDRSNRLNTFFY